MQSLPGQRATKAYPRWANVVSHLRERFDDDIKFVQIGTEKTSEPIAGVHVNLIGKTSLKEALGLLEHAAFHMDNEGGFVHAAAAFGKKSCVIFGLNCPPFRPDSRHKQKGSSTGLRIGLCLTSIDTLNC
ncbi:glycosyltransferase family 9 protein [Rhizobium sp. X9]|uniref:glycosyltransferase family 9 protein n=1 Tax=Rhizobium sp. X9 TaxID=2815360 RepID=UPI00345E2858